MPGQGRVFLRFFTSGIRKPAVKKKQLSSVNVALFAVTIKRHDNPKTPYQRIMKSVYINESVKLALSKQLENLNPFEPNTVIQMKLKKITRFR